MPNQENKKQPESSKEIGHQNKNRSAVNGEGAVKKAQADTTPKRRGRPRKSAQTQSAQTAAEQSQQEQAKKQTEEFGIKHFCYGDEFMTALAFWRDKGKEFRDFANGL